VRYEVASRIPLSKVAELADDDDLLVREMVLARLCVSKNAEGYVGMSNIVRDSDVVEISEPPYFSFGEKVKAKRISGMTGPMPVRKLARFWRRRGNGYVVSIVDVFAAVLYLWR